MCPYFSVTPNPATGSTCRSRASGRSSPAKTAGHRDTDVTELPILRILRNDNDSNLLGGMSSDGFSHRFHLRAKHAPSKSFLSTTRKGGVRARKNSAPKHWIMAGIIAGFDFDPLHGGRRAGRGRMFSTEFIFGTKHKFPTSVSG
jgi:hypothetical protein